jgi:hypothetical protein
MALSTAEASRPVHKVRVMFDVKVPMRDGVELSTDIYLPEIDSPLPTILIRTAYDNNNESVVQDCMYFATRGYAVAAQGIIRARYRDSWEEPTLLEPGKIYEYTIDLWSTSSRFLKGHQIRVEVSSSNFPQFERNPNTGNTFGMDTELRIANQTIYHDAEHLSHILLPIVPIE